MVSYLFLSDDRKMAYVRQLPYIGEPRWALILVYKFSYMCGL